MGEHRIDSVRCNTRDERRLRAHWDFSLREGSTAIRRAGRHFEDTGEVGQMEQGWRRRGSRGWEEEEKGRIEEERM